MTAYGCQIVLAGCARVIVFFSPERGCSSASLLRTLRPLSGTSPRSVWPSFAGEAAHVRRQVACIRLHRPQHGCVHNQIAGGKNEDAFLSHTGLGALGTLAVSVSAAASSAESVVAGELYVTESRDVALPANLMWLQAAFYVWEAEAGTGRGKYLPLTQR